MTNIRKQMAKLNPRSMPLEFSGSRGTGTPALTAIDISQALAASDGDPKRRLAINVLCLRWWPAMVDGPGIAQYRHAERKNRSGEKVVERVYIGERPADTPALLAVLGLVGRCLERYAKRLPDDTAEKVACPEFIARWSRAVVDEYRHPHVCRACAAFGRPGEAPIAKMEAGKVVGFVWTLCDSCGGTGAQPWGRDRRAAAVRIGVGTFRAQLQEGHEGALALLRELELRGQQLVEKKFAS